MKTYRYLMCPPDYFQIDWSINPYMDITHKVDPAVVQAQFDGLVQAHRQLGHKLEFMAPQPNLADLIFTANGALVIGPKVMLGHPRPDERKPEIPFFRAALEKLGYTDIIEAKNDFSGQGDALPVSDKLILMGNSWRTSPETAAEVAAFFGVETVSLATVRDTDLPDDVPANSRFYDIDIAISVLGPGVIAYAPDAFEAESQRRLLATIAKHHLTAYEIPLKEALTGTLNLVSDGETVMRPHVDAPTLAAAITSAGLKQVTLPITELWKGGGGVRCTTLNIFPA